MKKSTLGVIIGASTLAIGAALGLTNSKKIAKLFAKKNDPAEVRSNLIKFVSDTNSDIELVEFYDYASAQISSENEDNLVNANTVYKTLSGIIASDKIGTEDKIDIMYDYLENVLGVLNVSTSMQQQLYDEVNYNFTDDEEEDNSINAEEECVDEIIDTETEDIVVDEYIVNNTSGVSTEFHNDEDENVD